MASAVGFGGGLGGGLGGLSGGLGCLGVWLSYLGGGMSNRGGPVNTRVPFLRERLLRAPPVSAQIQFLYVVVICVFCS